MKTAAWHWLLVLMIPGCILVQPLDDPKSDGEGSAGSGNSSQAGNAGRNTAGSGPSAGGSGNRAGSGPLPEGGSGPRPTGGAPSAAGAPSGDLSLFTGTWTLTSGTNTYVCDGMAATTENAEVGAMDMAELGVTSDLVFAPGSNCEILADVTGYTASLSENTIPCSYSDSDYDYYQTTDSFKFVVSSNGQTAKASISSTIDRIGGMGVNTCEVTQSLNYKR